MSLRISATLGLEVGFNNQLDDLAFDGAIDELVDTMDNISSGTGELAAAASLALSMGSVTAGRMLWVEADGELDVTFGGAAATAAEVDAVGASYPLSPAGGETLTFDLDGNSISVTFLAGDTTVTAVVNRINSAIALAGYATPVASDNAGQVRLTSRTLGTLSLLETFAGTFLATLGLSGASDTQGLGPAGAAAPVGLARLADPAGTTVGTLKSYLLATANFTTVSITNPSATTALRYKYAIVGDLTPTVAC